MNQMHAKSVVVGVDGTQAAVNAARWAVDVYPDCSVLLIRD